MITQFYKDEMKWKCAVWFVYVHHKISTSLDKQCVKDVCFFDFFLLLLLLHSAVLFAVCVSLQMGDPVR